MKSCIKPAYCNAEKKKQLKVFTFVLMLLVLNVMLNIDSFAKIKGSGSKSDPYQGDELAATGDSILSGMYVKNLTYIDDKNKSSLRGQGTGNYTKCKRRQIS